MNRNKFFSLYGLIFLLIISIFTLSCDNTVNINTPPETVDIFYISSENFEYYNKVTFEKGHKLSSKEIPILSSSDTHYFNNWVDEQGNNITEGYILNKNNYFFASWTQTKVTSVVFSNDASCIDYKEELFLSTDTKDAKIFYTTDGTTPSYGSTLYTEPIILFSEGKNLSAPVIVKSIAVKDNLEPSDVVEHKYSMKTYTVTFDNKGYGSSVEPIQNLKKGDEVSLTDLGVDTTVTPNKVFINWMNNNIFVKGNLIIKDNINLEAVWIDYKQIEDVKFSVTGEVDYLDEIELSCSTPGVDIYYTKDGSNPSLESNQNRILYDVTKPIQIKDNITIKVYATHKKLPQSVVSEATYRIRTYTVTFVNDKNGENPLPITGLKKNDTVMTDKMPIFNLAGYDFKYWKTPNGNLFDSNYKITQNITLTAVLEPIVYNINYVLNADASNITNDNPIQYTVEDEIYLLTPFRSGWSADWYNDEGCMGDIVYSIPIGSTGDKTFYAKWTDIPPCEVSNLVAKVGSCKVTLSWDNPSEEDLEKVIITYDSNQTMTVFVSPNTSTIQEINSLTNDTEYTFNIKTVDYYGNESYGTSINATPIPVYDYTETPRVIDTQIINGINYDIVEFGDWPQTVYSGDPSILKSCNKINAWNNCYMDDIGNFYVKVTASPYDSSYTYSDGTAIKDGQVYYFRVEPIRWRVITDNYNGYKLLLSEKILSCDCYFYNFGNYGRNINGESIEDNNYKESGIRAFLNGGDYMDFKSEICSAYRNRGFLQKAFTSSAIEKIEYTLVDNSAESTTDYDNILTKATSYSCDDTSDKMFFLSEKEVTNPDYGFISWDSMDVERQKQVTDFAKAVGSFAASDGTGHWWLRSPNYVNWHTTRVISNKGTADSYIEVGARSMGIVPALSISF